MEFREIKNKEGDVMKTKEGKPLLELRFEVGDTFIPLYNSVLEKSREVEVNGKKQTITNYSLKCKVRDANGVDVVQDGETEIFVTLTPAQAKSLKKKVAEGIELNQNLFIAYQYQSKDYGSQIGIGIKKENKPSKNFEDFEVVEQD